MELENISFDEIEDKIIYGLEPDIYNWDLLKWISSNLTRASYVDDALLETNFKTLWSLLGWTQVDAMREVYQIGFEFVRWYLNEYEVDETMSRKIIFATYKSTGKYSEIIEFDDLDTDVDISKYFLNWLCEQHDAYWVEEE